MNDLIGQEIIIPAWSESVDAGDNKQYKVGRFVKIALRGNSLNGKGWVGLAHSKQVHTQTQGKCNQVEVDKGWVGLG
ncbi:MAG: hypothetical protein KUG82_15820, partial [Pseudomonadales bacterium]|nr:hypothetical protein [Pseudomonadales bacterium]